MKNEKLTGIERELVLQYLIDGNVPVTVTPVESENDADTIHSVPSQIFPVVIKGENVKVSKSGEISLKNLPQSAVSFKSKNVKVEFYFNRVGVFFESKISETKDGYTIELPKEISRIQDVEEEHLYDFSSVIYFDFNNKKDLNIKCVPSKIVELFERPVWKLIPLENQKKAKDLLEKFVEEARKLHDLSPLATAAMGRVLTITSLIGAEMKNKTDKLTIQIKGKGKIGGMGCDVFSVEPLPNGHPFEKLYGLKNVFV